jgi:hypothetical protein
MRWLLGALLGAGPCKATRHKTNTTQSTRPHRSPMPSTPTAPPTARSHARLKAGRPRRRPSEGRPPFQSKTGLLRTCHRRAADFADLSPTFPSRHRVVRVVSKSSES